MKTEDPSLAARREPQSDRADELQAFIEREGYRRCDVPACNCNSFHGGHAFARLMEIEDALREADVELNGRTILSAVKELAARREPPPESPLLTYMTTADGPERDAAFLRLYAEKIRNGTAATWEIPSTVAGTIEAIADRMRQPGWTCKAQRTADPPPQDCNWPVCGCDPYADKVIAALEESGLAAGRREPPPETTMVALTEAEIQGLSDYVRWHGSVHVEGCPCDDTCDCIARPLNDAVNAICRKAFDAQVLAVGRPTPPEAG